MELFFRQVLKSSRVGKGKWSGGDCDRPLLGATEAPVGPI
jgi:hypothetical protein